MHHSLNCFEISSDTSLIGGGDCSLSLVSIVSKVNYQSISGFDGLFPFAWDRRTLIGLGYLTMKRPDALHAGHVFCIYCDGSYSMDNLQPGMACVLTEMRFSYLRRRRTWCEVRGLPRPNLPTSASEFRHRILNSSVALWKIVWKIKFPI